MKILITAGSTQMPIDQVRTISNIFKGKTGTSIAWYASKEHMVTLIGNPASKQMLEKWEKENLGQGYNYIRFIEYKTFDELEARMNEEIIFGKYDVIIHSAAVSDYRPVDVMIQEYNSTNKNSNEKTELISVKAAKVSSEYPEIFIKCIQTPKLIDYIREPWGFKGILVKFKLQVGITKAKLLEIASSSRKTSSADLIVANVLDDFDQPSPNMYICGDGTLIESTRKNLPSNLLNIISEFKK